MKEHQRLIRFTLVGLTGTILDVSIYNVLILLFKMPFQFAQVFSFTAGLLNNFYWNRRWTYPEYRTQPVLSQLSKFTFFSVIGLFIRTVIIILLDPFAVQTLRSLNFSILGMTPESAGHNFALGIAIVIVLFWNFISNRLWTFRRSIPEKLNHD